MTAQINSKFWFGRKVLLTGHTGFKGSWLCLWLQSMGADIRGVALHPPTVPALFDLARISEGIDHNVADIRDYFTFSNLVKDFQPEICIHMAAQPLVRMSYQQPIETYATNVMGSVHLFEAARNAGSVRVILNITTDKCYENQEWVWGYRERDRMGGNDPYSSSKACAELISSAYRNSFLASEGISMATVRAGNVIGGGDWATDRLVPDILRALEKGESVQIRNPYAIRPWQHVLEPLSGYILLVEKLYEEGQAFAEGWNFGPNNEDARTVSWITEELCKIWGKDSSWHLQAGDHPHEANYLKLDITKAKFRLNWEPRLSIGQALEYVTSWHREWLNASDMRDVTLQQIKEYENTGQNSVTSLRKYNANSY